MASPAANANGHRRRQVRARVLAEETDCHLCGKSVDQALTIAWGHHGPKCQGEGCPGCVPHPMRAEVDEIIPRSKGGNPLDRDNCRLSHRRCNRAKGNGDNRQPTPAEPTAFPLTNSWGGTFDTLHT